MRQSCAGESHCGWMKMTTTYILSPAMNVFESQPTPNIDKPFVATQPALENAPEAAKIICLVQTTTSEQCRTCIARVGNSNYSGQLRIVYPMGTKRLILHVFYSIKRVKDIVDSCRTSAACSDEAVQISAKVCKLLVIGSPMRNIQLHDDSDLYITETTTTPKIYPEVQNFFKGSPVKQTCLNQICNPLVHMGAHEVSS